MVRTVREEIKQRYNTEASTKTDVRTLRDYGWEAFAEYDGPFWVIGIQDSYNDDEAYTIRYKDQVAQFIEG